MINSGLVNASKALKRAPVWLLAISLTGIFAISVLTITLLTILTTDTSTMIVTAEGTEDQPLGVIVDDKLTVIDIESNSAAEHAGIKPGDKLKKVGDVTVTSSEQARNVLNDKVAEPVIAAKGDQALEKSKVKPILVVVIRNGIEVVLPVTPSSRNPKDTGVPPTPVPQNQLYF